MRPNVCCLLPYVGVATPHTQKKERRSAVAASHGCPSSSSSLFSLFSFFLSYSMGRRKEACPCHPKTRLPIPNSNCFFVSAAAPAPLSSCLFPTRRKRNHPPSHNLFAQQIRYTETHTNTDTAQQTDAHGHKSPAKSTGRLPPDAWMDGSIYQSEVGPCFLCWLWA